MGIPDSPQSTVYLVIGYLSATWPTGDIELATLERRDIGSIDLDRFVTDCREANAENEAHKAMQEVVTRAVSYSRH